MWTPQDYVICENEFISLLVGDKRADYIKWKFKSRHSSHIKEDIVTKKKTNTLAILMWAFSYREYSFVLYIHKYTHILYIYI